MIRRVYTGNTREEAERWVPGLPGPHIVSCLGCILRPCHEKELSSCWRCSEFMLLFCIQTKVWNECSLCVANPPAGMHFPEMFVQVWERKYKRKATTVLLKQKTVLSTQQRTSGQWWFLLREAPLGQSWGASTERHPLWGCVTVLKTGK